MERLEATVLRRAGTLERMSLRWPLPSRTGRILRNWLAVFAGTVPMLVSAADLIADDFESGNLSTWGSPSVTSGLNTLRAETEAAHRGSFGMRFVDANGASGDGDEGGIGLNTAPLVDSYMRGWIRITASNGLGRITVIDFFNGSANLNNTNLVFNSRLYQLSGSDRGGAYPEANATPAFERGEWHLVEAAVRGGGTAAGERSLWIDGVLQGRHSNLDWASSAWVTRRIAIGAPYSKDRRFQGTVDFDDVRFTTHAPASTLRTSIAATGNGCRAVTVELVDSGAAALAPAPYDVDAAFQIPGTVHQANDCSDAASTTLRIAAGSTSATGYLRFTEAGTFDVSASQPDFLSSPPVSVEVEEGTALEPTPPNPTAPEGGGNADGNGNGADNGDGDVRESLYRFGCAVGGEALTWAALLPLLFLAARTCSPSCARTAAQSRRCGPSSRCSGRSSRRAR